MAIPLDVDECRARSPVIGEFPLYASFISDIIEPEVAEVSVESRPAMWACQECFR